MIPSPYKPAVCLSLQDDELVVVAVDGFRLALRREKVEHHEPMRFIVPGKTLGEPAEADGRGR